MSSATSSVSNGSGLPGYIPCWNRPEGPCLAQEPRSNLIRVTCVRLLPGPDIRPRFSGRVVPEPWFHIMVSATLAPSKYMSFDRIMTWSICRLYRINRAFTSRIQIGDPSNSHWVALKKRTILGEIPGFLIATKRILVGLQIWTREVKEQLILHNLRIDHITIQSELRYLIGA